MQWDEWLRRTGQRIVDQLRDPPAGYLYDECLEPPLIDEEDTELRHGWYGTYTNHGCRCRDCRVAWAKYRLEQRRARRKERS